MGSGYLMLVLDIPAISFYYKSPFSYDHCQPLSSRIVEFYMIPGVVINNYSFTTLLVVLLVLNGSKLNVLYTIHERETRGFVYDFGVMGNRFFYETCVEILVLL